MYQEVLKPHEMFLGKSLEFGYLGEQIRDALRPTLHDPQTNMIMMMMVVYISINSKLFKNSIEWTPLNRSAMLRRILIPLEM